MGLQDWTPTSVRAKIKSIRGTHNIELSKITKSKKSGIEAAKVYMPNIRWFHLMQEFMNVTKEKRTTTDELHPMPGGEEISKKFSVGVGTVTERNGHGEKTTSPATPSTSESTPEKSGQITKVTNNVLSAAIQSTIFNDK
ncbi:hypothetical protein HNY73_005977 [Argiope bruennichi]|uniref:Uncharacterized protein n=1 Tax=Argiope bruennichi TaxID=94029 RepID=A0A8T0FIF4_ARGBR|nr:hypothetical protein HNY73_005977 [Argiope bruennichi]